MLSFSMSKGCRSAVAAGLVLFLPLAASHGAKEKDLPPGAMRIQIDKANDKVRRALVRIRVVSD